MIIAYDGRTVDGRGRTNKEHACEEYGGLICGTHVDPLWYDNSREEPDTFVPSCLRCQRILAKQSKTPIPQISPRGV